MHRFDVITLFPNLIHEHFKLLPVKRAVEEGISQFNVINLRDFAIDKRGTVDDKPFGGGVGMVLMVEPIYNAVEQAKEFAHQQNHTFEETHIILLAPSGEIYTQQQAMKFAGYTVPEKSNFTGTKTSPTAMSSPNTTDSTKTTPKSKHFIFICGRYEGVDARVAKSIATEVISIGKYVISGGELAALVIIESIVRLLPGVLEKEEAPAIESYTGGFSDNHKEYPQYTRPADFMGMKVPEVLLSGNHREVEKWRIEHSEP